MKSQLRLLLAPMALLPAGMYSPWLPAARADAAQPLVLQAESFRHHVERFNDDDEELYRNAFANAEAWEFLKANIPLFQCPDEDIQRTYYFRFWTYRKHLKKTPDGWVVTEFLPDVPWSGKHNTICCPAGHHFYEGRWLHDPKHLDDYAVFWFRKGGSPRPYSFWAADAQYARYLVEETGAGCTHTAVYTIDSCGRMEVANKIEPFGCDEVPFFGRVGVDFIVQPQFEQLKWYGRGPHENYVDRKASADVGIYHSSVTDQFEPYARPQACGNKEDVRRLWLLDREGRGLCVRAADKLCATALHYTTAQLDDAWRLDELKPIKEIVLSLDHAQQGLGNGSCGTPITMDKYQLKRRDCYEFTFTLQAAK